MSGLLNNGEIDHVGVAEMEVPPNGQAGEAPRKDEEHVWNVQEAVLGNESVKLATK